nr:hypothetical protein Iba_chr07eCG1330 [Ipomoea batatas]
MRNNSTQIVAIKVEVLKLSQLPNLMRNNSTNEVVYTKVEVLKLRQVPNLWRDVETSEAGKRSKIEVVKSTTETNVRKIDLRDSSTSIADNARPITKNEDDTKKDRQGSLLKIGWPEMKPHCVMDGYIDP